MDTYQAISKKCKWTGDFDTNINSSLDLGMQFGIEKDAMLIMTNWKREKIKGIELPHLDRIRTL